MSVSSAYADQLDDALLNLKAKNHPVRVQAAKDLRRCLQNALAEMPSAAAARLWDDIMAQMGLLVNSPDVSEKIGGVIAIGQIYDLEKPETLQSKQNLYRLQSRLRSCLPDPDVRVVKAAAETLGRIVKFGGTNFYERLMEFEIPAAIEILESDEQENGRLTGVLVLKELAVNNATLFLQHIPLVLDKLLIPLRDFRPYIREAAAELLSACLDIILKRERLPHVNLVNKVLQEAQVGLKATSVETVHGSLLMYRELLLHGEMLMKDRYNDAVESILKYRNHRHPLIRRTVTGLIPTLAKYDTQSFTEHFLRKTMSHLLAQMQKPTDRSEALKAVGLIAKTVGSDITPYLEAIMEQVRISLQNHGKKLSADQEQVFNCLAMLASAVGPHLAKLIVDELDLVFACGLSEPLTRALQEIVKCIPPLLKTVQERLLDLISKILCSQPYEPLGAPSPHIEPSPSVLPQETSATPKSPELLALALRTLGSFDFNGIPLGEFMRRCALPYLEDDSPVVRKEAALTTCVLFVNDPVIHQASNHSVQIITDVVNKLITVGVADPDPEIRQAILSSFDERLDKHLSQKEHVRSLMAAINDEVFQIRLTAVVLIGRLANCNPAYVVSSGRKALIQLLTELEYTTATRSKEECTQLLALFVNASQQLIKPYVIPMMHTLLPKANDPNIVVSANIIKCLGELACIGGESALPHVPALMDVIIERLVDPSPLKRDAALHTLGQVCSSTGYVIQPLVDHPQLFGILNKILKTETTPAVTREVLRVYGILGAIDPYKREIRDKLEIRNTAASASNSTHDLPLMTVVPMEYYQAVVIGALIKILHDPTLNSHHHTVVEAIMAIFKTQGLKCASFLPQVIPAFAAVTRTASTPRYQEFHLQQLAILIGIINQQVRNYALQIFHLVSELWSNKGLLLPLITLIEALGKALDAEFKPFMSSVLPLMLQVFEGELTDKQQTTQVKVLDAFLTFGPNIEEYLHLILPCIIASYERQDASTVLRKRAVQTIDGLTRRVNFADHASRLVHPLVRSLGPANNELRMAILDTLCSLLMQLGPDFAVFVPTISKCMQQHKISHSKFEHIVPRLMSGEPLSHDTTFFDIAMRSGHTALEISVPAEAAKMPVNQQQLKAVWDTSNVRSEEDWYAWMHRLSVEFMRQSPSHALRACMNIVEHYPPLARDLFNAAFLSCWTELHNATQEVLVRAIEQAMSAPKIAPELITGLLNLAEFMEHVDKPLPIEHHTLGNYAMNNNINAKALHYKELEFFMQPQASESVLEDLIEINAKLQQHDAASGALSLSADYYGTGKLEEWHERLGQWDDAQHDYEEKLSRDPENVAYKLGVMRCYHALGHWDALSKWIEDLWPNATEEQRMTIAPMAAATSWHLEEWDAMEGILSVLKGSSPDKAFYKSIISVRQNQFPKALSNIDRARDLLVNELKSIGGMDHERTYKYMVRAQVLSELEEIIQYKQYADQPDRQETIRKTWMKRLQGCKSEVEVWQRVLQVRALVLSPQEGMTMWTKFINVCRKAGKKFLVDKTMFSLLGMNNALDGQVDPAQKAPPAVIYAQLKFMWSNNQKVAALSHLRGFTASLSRDLASAKDRRPRNNISFQLYQQKRDLTRLLARCYFKQGEWTDALQSHPEQDTRKEIVNLFWLATQFDQTWYKAWHTWALSCFDLVNHLVGHGHVDSQGNQNDISGQMLVKYVGDAVNGFLQSIALRTGNALQDALRLLTLWFRFGGHQDISNGMVNGFSAVDVDVWLEVIPQIIARIQIADENIRRNISILLLEIGKHHPQALVYPLTVASKSTNKDRQRAALAILERMKSHSTNIVDQAILVSKELVRTAILWHELWSEGLEEASRVYCSDKGAEGMIDVLEPLHALLNAGPETSREESFEQLFGKDLREARAATHRYRIYGDVVEIDRAWETYTEVFRKIQKLLQKLNTLDLQYVSPELLRARNLDLAVPGTYQSGQPVVKISFFVRTLPVISSKQRPRRLHIQGSNGLDYEFCLKGLDDLRQDERVMQFFGLVNTLLSKDVESFKRRLHIQCYSVTPLAPNVGLLSWVQDSDPLHVLIRDYRDSRKILLNLEYMLMQQMAETYETLTLMQKMEVFEHALETTTGQDLYRVLWLKSVNSEHWLERRETYTRSLAVTSMVGHILGVGDRHPSNVLLGRKTGQVVHIDFGDCFEIAMRREKYPETVPFRLTRMLTNAMEVSGVWGTFKQTANNTMRVLRDNDDSLMAVLEAFVYDPLINWRLLQTVGGGGRRAEDAVDDSRAQRYARAAANPQGPARRPRTDENNLLSGRQSSTADQIEKVFSRVRDKLSGRDFNPNEELSVEAQVARLITEATSLENLCQLFSGWCAFW